MRTVFSGGKVFDGSGADIATADVVIEDGRIVDVGPGLDGDEQVDATGKTLLPGLFDCHVHPLMSHLDLMRNFQTPFSYKYYACARNLETILRLGITTVRDAGGSDLGIKQAVQEGLINGPRMQISIVMLSQTGGHGDSWMPCGAHISARTVDPGRPNHIVDGPDEMRKKVRELVRMGADVIKVAVSGGVLSPRDKPTHAHFRPIELEVLVEEATAAGVFVMSHAQATDGIKNAIRAGVRSIDHGIYLDDEAIDLMIERGTWLVPTLLAPRGVIAAAEAGVALTDAAVQKAHEVIDVHTESFRRAVEAGVKVAMGTDCPVSPHGTNLGELELMSKLSDMSPLDSLVATTSSAAELMGLSDELGTLEAGKRADVVVVDGDPLDLVTLSDRIEQVWKDGARVV
ncbi:MAG TPA: amidohydrolase family protein [Acidimicrobiales bacterium]|nr:amidohydrolase family protein [Acidimicrobiales bacterium]